MSHDMNFEDLLKSFALEISEEYSFQDTGIEIDNPRILNWYRERDGRPWHVDYALCFAEVRYSKKHEYALGLMARNPMAKNSEWHAARIIDGGIDDYWLRLLQKAPTVEESYLQIRRFTKQSRKGWERYASMEHDV